MNNYKEKYIKYKAKYLKLTNNMKGGNDECDNKDYIEEQKQKIIKNIKYTGDRIFEELYHECLNKNDIDEATRYIDKNRKLGKKIMLIVGDIPLKNDEFDIPLGYVPLYVEDDIRLEFYTRLTMEEKKDNVINKLTKSFDEYPVVFTSPFSVEKFKNKFDLIIFDTGTVYWMKLTTNLTKNSLLNIFKYVHDNSSILVFDNKHNQRQPSNWFNKGTDTVLPMYSTYSNYDEVKEYYINWVKNNSFFNDPIIVNTLKEFYTTIDTNKLIMSFSNRNIYHTSSSLDTLFIYIKNMPSFAQQYQPNIEETNEETKEK